MNRNTLAENEIRSCSKSIEQKRTKNASEISCHYMCFAWFVRVCVSSAKYVPALVPSVKYLMGKKQQKKEENFSSLIVVFPHKTFSIQIMQKFRSCSVRIRVHNSIYANGTQCALPRTWHQRTTYRIIIIIISVLKHVTSNV